MGSTTDKIKGYANEAAGKAKQGVGKVTGNDKMRAEGAAQEAKGDAQKDGRHGEGRDQERRRQGRGQGPREA